jgi:hypothetical protein
VTAAAALTALFLVSATAAEGEKTLWLVQPLYPGQEVLVGRTEEALDKLIPKEGRSREVIGRKELAVSLAIKGGDLACLFGDKACKDPIDAFVESLGFDRVVLVRGGQDEKGYLYKVVSYRPSSGEVSPAEAANPGLERALLGALVKVVPLASSLEVGSTPPGATVYVDGVKVGLTPLSTQVLPGERVIKLDLKSHQPVEESLVIPVRGTAKFERPLEKIAARVTITASPAGTEITLDGQAAGQDKIDRGIGPGSHTVRLAREGYKAFETMFEVKADEAYTLDKSLEAIPAPPALVVKPVDVPVAPPTKVVIVKQPDPSPTNPGVVAPPPVVAEVASPPPPAPSIEEQIYERKAYFLVSFEATQLSGTLLSSTRYEGATRADRLFDGKPTLMGASIEYGTFGRHFGLAVIGLAYAQPSAPQNIGVSDPSMKLVDGVDVTKDRILANVRLVTLRALQPQFRWVLWRLTLALQAGLEVRTGQILEVDPVPWYPNGFNPLDLLFSVRGSVRANLVEGLFVHASYAATFCILSQNSGARGFTAGVGYAF